MFEVQTLCVCLYIVIGHLDISKVPLKEEVSPNKLYKSGSSPFIFITQTHKKKKSILKPVRAYDQTVIISHSLLCNYVEWFC